MFFTATAIACLMSSPRRLLAACIVQPADLRADAPTSRFIELGTVFAQRRVALGFDVIQDLRHGARRCFQRRKSPGASAARRCCCASLQVFQSMIVLKLMAITPSSSQSAAPGWSWRPAPSVFPWFPRTGFRCSPCASPRAAERPPAAGWLGARRPAAGR